MQISGNKKQIKKEIIKFIFTIFTEFSYDFILWLKCGKKKKKKKTSFFSNLLCLAHNTEDYRRLSAVKYTGKQLRQCCFAYISCSAQYLILSKLPSDPGI